MPNNYGPYQPYTGFFTRDPNTNNSQDLGQRYITKDYLLDVYPNIASQLGNRTSSGLFAWGDNTSGILGLGDADQRSSPVQVGSLTNWRQVSNGGATTSCVKTDGTLWAWGFNSNGELGIGGTVTRSSPVQVGTLTNWKQVSCGGKNNGFTACVKTDGTLWMWGTNNYGRLGRGNTTNLQSPVQLGNLTNWKQVSAGGNQTGCVKTDGTLWMWGVNNLGQLGLGDIVHRSSPVQVGSLTNWKQVSVGGGASTPADGHVACVKTDGTLWTWGRNSSGELGRGNVVASFSPIQVGTLTNWKQVNAGGASTACIKTDGTLWIWGSGILSGQLGLGDLLDRSSPVQVGTLTNWKQIDLSPSRVTHAILDATF